MKNYSLQIPFKTKLLNLFRLLFTVKPFENVIYKLNKDNTSYFYSKLIPPNYLYAKKSIRNVTRNGLNYELDLSDVVDHFIFFDLPDNSIKKLYSLIKKDMIVFDIGANMGYTALNFSKIIETKGTVIAFEPDEINYKRADKNITLNKITNIQLYNIGLGRETKNEKLYIVNDGNRGMNRILSSSSNLSFSEIQIQKLDAFVLNHKIQKLDFIKIDVEGYEMEILNGGAQTIKKFQPILFIEADENNLKEQKSSVSELLKFLADSNYAVYKAETDELLDYSQDYFNAHFDCYALPNK